MENVVEPIFNIKKKNTLVHWISNQFHIFSRFICDWYRILMYIKINNYIIFSVYDEKTAEQYQFNVGETNHPFNDPKSYHSPNLPVNL